MAFTDCLNKVKVITSILQKILLTSDNRSLLEANLRRYQQVATFSSSLAPLLAAFVPPRDSHVLYLVYPGLELVREIVSSEMLMRVSFALLSAHYDLRSQKISFSMIRPLQFLARMTTDCEPHFVLLPNFTALEGDTDSDLGNLIETLRVRTSFFFRFLISFQINSSFCRRRRYLKRLQRQL